MVKANKRTHASKPTAAEVQLAEQVFQPAAASASTQNKRKQQDTQLKAAWVDDDDAHVEVSLADQKRLRKLRKTEEDTQVDGHELQTRLKKQFQSSSSSVAWADPKNFLDDTKPQQRDADDSDEEEIFSADGIVRSTGKMLESSGDMLQQGTLDICRMKDANQHNPSNAVIQSVQFHPNGQLLLTAGLDKTLHLFQVDGTNNAKVENVFVKDLPMLDAKFTLGGSRVVLSGPRSYFFSYDLEAGKITKIPGIIGRKEKKLERFTVSQSGDRIVFLGSDGYMSVMSSRSYEWIGNMKMNGDVRSATFCEDDRYLLSTGSDGQIYKWDMRTRKCVFVHQDEGSLGNHVIAASRDGKFYAAGSESGVVNVYDNTGLTSPSKPRKSLMQLTTEVTSLQFNSDSQILAMASKDSRDALKFVHLPSFTVFSNWPTARTPLHYVSAMDFSPSCGYFAVGNARGRVLLYRLTHYKST
uniref:U3 small nucleolar RNA-associated protein 18 homolog n=1 Tax=Globisporangium ultimum (strain ATCC 200006 / CBS 805.95 / DAOM BR144) TaxID=431595 RepID=K3WHM9_GLOUD